MRHDAVQDLDRRAGDGKARRIEPHGVQGTGARINQVPGRQVLCGVALHNRTLLSCIQRADDDLRVVERLQIRGLHGEQNRPPAREELRPAVRHLIGAWLDGGQRFGLSSAIGDTEQAPTDRRRKGNRAVVGPCGAPYP